MKECLNRVMIEIEENETGNVRKILFLTANPKSSSPLRLEEELRKVKDELNKNNCKRFFSID